MIDWMIEAFLEDTEELAWEFLLTGLEREDLEEELNISLPTPDSYAITVEQVVAAVLASSSGVSPNDLDLNADRFSFFLAATKRD
jgi:hypothetical protein